MSQPNHPAFKVTLIHYQTSQLAISPDLAAASESLLMHSSTAGFICAKLTSCLKNFAQFCRVRCQCWQKESSIVKIIILPNFVCRQHSNRQNLDDKLKPEIWCLLLWFIWFAYHRYNCPFSSMAVALETKFSLSGNFRRILGVSKRRLRMFCRLRASRQPGSSWKALVSREDGVNGCLSPTITLLSSRSNCSPRVLDSDDGVPLIFSL